MSDTTVQAAPLDFTLMKEGTRLRSRKNPSKKYLFDKRDQTTGGIYAFTFDDGGTQSVHTKLFKPEHLSGFELDQVEQKPLVNEEVFNKIRINLITTKEYIDQIEALSKENEQLINSIIL